MQNSTYPDQPALPLKLNDSEPPNTSPLLEKLRRIEQGLSPPEISPAPEIPKLPPQNFLENERQLCFSSVRERIESTVIFLEEERMSAINAGDTIRENVVVDQINKRVEMLKSFENYIESDKFVELLTGRWEKRVKQIRDGNVNEQTEHYEGDPLSAIFPIQPRDSARLLEKHQIDHETFLKKQEIRRRGGRRTKWDGLREEIRKADKETPKPQDDVIANRYNKRFSASINCGTRPRADANKVREVRDNMKRSRRT